MFAKHLLRARLLLSVQTPWVKSPEPPQPSLSDWGAHTLSHFTVLLNVSSSFWWWFHSSRGKVVDLLLVLDRFTLPMFFVPIPSQRLVPCPTPLGLPESANSPTHTHTHPERPNNLSWHRILNVSMPQLQWLPDPCPTLTMQSLPFGCGGLRFDTPLSYCLQFVYQIYLKQLQRHLSDSASLSYFILLATASVQILVIS